MRARTKGLALAVAVGFFCIGQARAQKCPRGPVNAAELIAQMEATKDPNVILRAAAIGGLALMPELRKLSIPETSSETVGWGGTGRPGEIWGRSHVRGARH
jgi:hypothetical protein